MDPEASGAAKCSRQGGLDFSLEASPVGYDASHPSRAVSAVYIVAVDVAVNPEASGAAKCSRQGGPDFSFESNPVGYDDFHPSRAVSACPAYAVAIDEIIFVAVDIAPRIPKHLAPQSALDKGVLIFRMRRILLDMMTLIPVVLYLASSAYAAAVDEANIAVVCDFYADLCADIALQFCCSAPSAIFAAIVDAKVCQVAPIFAAVADG